MRSFVSLLSIALVAGLMLRGQVSTPHTEASMEPVQIEAHGALAISYAQVLLRVINNQNSPLFIPVCSDEICWYFGYLEQKEDRGRLNWRRTRTTTHAADILLPTRMITIEKDESYGFVFHFSPREETFPDGSHLRYPGTVRAVILAWPDKQSIDDPAKAIPLRSQEFDIPPPPEAWGPARLGN